MRVSLAPGVPAFAGVAHAGGPRQDDAHNGDLDQTGHGFSPRNPVPFALRAPPGAASSKGSHLLSRLVMTHLGQMNRPTCGA